LFVPDFADQRKRRPFPDHGKRQLVIACGQIVRVRVTEIKNNTLMGDRII
jgi:hypothetical protein